MNTCTVDGCKNKILRKSLCNAHYLRLMRHGDPTKGRTPNGEVHKYLKSLLNSEQPDECVVWPYRKDKNGYARIDINGKDSLVHRVICESVHGIQPDDNLSNVAHSCGNGSKGCVNFKHLRWATYSQNERDKLIHGTHNRGERSGVHKLTEKEVVEIRNHTEKGTFSHSELSKIYSISVGQISRIRNRIDWAWLK